MSDETNQTYPNLPTHTPPPQSAAGEVLLRGESGVLGATNADELVAALYSYTTYSRGARKRQTWLLQRLKVSGYSTTLGHPLMGVAPQCTLLQANLCWFYPNEI